jgi:NAD-dependent dihydropyrimidine dehydrogenase PreA subunit
MKNPNCKEPGKVQPVIDRKKCEGKEDCLRVCPVGVFEIRVLNEDERQALPLFPYRLKAWAHGYKQAFATKASACENCGLCVTACPEKAIKLQPITAAAAAGT